MKSKIFSSIIAGCLCLAAAIHASPVTLALDPSSDALAGLAGATVGWGFTLGNPSDFAVISFSNFCQGNSGVNNLCIGPTNGTHTDAIASNYTISGPAPESPVVSEPFTSAGSGLGSFQINSTAICGNHRYRPDRRDLRSISIDPNAPNFNPMADLLSAGNFRTAPASVSVTVPKTATAEPSSRAYGHGERFGGIDFSPRR